MCSVEHIPAPPFFQKSNIFFNSLNPNVAPVATLTFFNTYIWSCIKTKVFNKTDFCFRFLIFIYFIITYAKFNKFTTKTLFYFIIWVTGSLSQSKYWGIQWANEHDKWQKVLEVCLTTLGIFTFVVKSSTDRRWQVLCILRNKLFSLPCS